MMFKNWVATVCGLCCSVCSLAGKICNEPCSIAKGEMIWGLCPIYACCAEKGFEHCGFCPDFPNCEPMKYIEDLEKTLGIPMNNKIRARNLKRRMEIGTEKWIEEMESRFK